MSGSLQGLQNDDLAVAVEYSLVQISFFRSADLDSTR
jgi:hypothetical protein